VASQLFRGKTIHISIHTPKESHFGWSLCIQFGRDTSLRNFENHDDSPSTSKYLETWGNFAHSFGTYIVYRKITHEMMETDLPPFSIQPFNCHHAQCQAALSHGKWRQRVATSTWKHCRVAQSRWHLRIFAGECLARARDLYNGVWYLKTGRLTQECRNCDKPVRSF
jgi:hypothetical protein